jgi:hypothetical protein
LPNQITCLWNAPTVPRKFSTAISLHSHTQYSQEYLYFIPAFANKSRVLRWALARQERRCTKVRPDFDKGYWTPPLSAHAAYEVERLQIEEVLNLASIVALTDHNSIEAPLLLHLALPPNSVPISVEWSVPFETTEFHLGIHNLPPSSAPDLVAAMNQYTDNPRESRLSELLAWLSEESGTLVILNHPLWDIGRVGCASLRCLLEKFLRCNLSFLHAFEVNGLRSWRENRRVLELAEIWRRPIISGGDRHGREPSGNLNLSRAASFAEFAGEIRKDRYSHVLFMPQYRQNLELRMVHTFLDVIREYPGHPLGASWDRRVFHPDPFGVVQPLAALWSKPPEFIETIFSAFRLLEASPVQRITRLALNRSHHALRLPLRPGGEAA